MKNLEVQRIIDDIGYGLNDMFKLVLKGELKRLLNRPEHHLALGSLMIVFALMISIYNL